MTTKATHTPGPWLADYRLTGGQIAVTQETNANMQVARVNGKAGEQEANARLIASAPALLAALTTIANLKMDGELLDPDDEESAFDMTSDDAVDTLHSCIDSARAAIALAKGE